MERETHPAPDQIERFALGEAGLEESRFVVGHLLRAALPARGWSGPPGTAADRSWRGWSSCRSIDMARRRKPESREKPFLRRFPQARYWLERGLHPRAARELVKAGFLKVEDLARTTREDLDALPGVGATTLEHLERLRGGPLVSPAGYWLERGLRPRLAHSLAGLGIDSVEKLGRMTREQLLRLPGVGEGSLEAVEAVLGRPLASPVQERRKRTS